MVFSNVYVRKVSHLPRANKYLITSSVGQKKRYFFVGFMGKKCETSAGATTAAPLKCSDCASTGTQYCTADGGVFYCVCKTGKKWDYESMIVLSFIIG